MYNPAKADRCLLLWKKWMWMKGSKCQFKLKYSFEPSQVIHRSSTRKKLFIHKGCGQGHKQFSMRSSTEKKIFPPAYWVGLIFFINTSIVFLMLFLLRVRSLSTLS